MNPQQIEQLRFSLSQPRYADWPTVPVVPGQWQELTGDLALTTVISICEWLEDERDIRNLAADWSIDRIRVRSLACYEDSLLVELGGHAGYGRPGLMNVIVHDDGMALLNGTSLVIHDLNDEIAPCLGTTEQRLDYVQLFMNWVHGENGRFQPVGNEAALRARLLADTPVSLNLPALSAFEPTPPPDEADALAFFSGTVLYGASLFRSVMALRQGGLMEMMDDEMLMTDLPVREESLVGPMIISRM